MIACPASGGSFSPSRSREPDEERAPPACGRGGSALAGRALPAAPGAATPIPKPRSAVASAEVSSLRRRAAPRAVALEPSCPSSRLSAAAAPVPPAEPLPGGPLRAAYGPGACDKKPGVEPAAAGAAAVRASLVGPELGSACATGTGGAAPTETGAGAEVETSTEGTGGAVVETSVVGVLGTPGAGSDGVFGGGGIAGAGSETDAPSSAPCAGAHKQSAPQSAATNGNTMLAFLGDVIHNPQSEYGSTTCVQYPGLHLVMHRDDLQRDARVLGRTRKPLLGALEDVTMAFWGAPADVAAGEPLAARAACGRALSPGGCLPCARR